MMNQEHRELVQAGFDGELDAAGRARLETLLAESEEARVLMADLEAIDAFLDRAPPLEAPAGLHSRIVDGISLPQPSRFLSLFSLSDLPGVLRYGLAASAAVLLTVAVYRVGNEMDPSVDYDQMVGTIASGGPVAGGEVIDRFGFEAEGASAEIKLMERGGVYALEFELDSEAPLQFDVDFSGIGLEFDAFARQDEDLEAVSWSGETLSARARGQQKFVILMRRTGEGAEAGSRIGLEISREGSSIETGWLEPGW